MFKTPPLRELAEGAGISVGCHPDFLPPVTLDEDMAALTVREFDTCVFNVFHWNALQPEGPDSWDWRASDAVVDWAERSGLALRGHALLWYQMLPGWLLDCSGADEIECRIRVHITAVVSRYGGRVKSWDVVNEALWVSDGQESGLRQDFLFRHFGERYLDVAFDAAREAEPGAELVLNEALLTHRDQQPQREAFSSLVSRLLSRGVPLDAIGIQSHLHWDDLQPMGPLDPEATAGLIGDLGGEGVTALLTELDVFDTAFSADPAGRDAMVAETYSHFLQAVLSEPALRSVVFWGLGDRRSWYNTYVRRVLPDRLPSASWIARPLLFDSDYQPKPAYFAVARALEAARLSRHGQNSASVAPVAA